MSNQRDHLVLGLAFVAAIVLHAAVLPWVGAAVGKVYEQQQIDLDLYGFDAPSYAIADDHTTITNSVISQNPGSEPVRVDVKLRVVLSRDRKADEQDLVVSHSEFAIPTHVGAEKLSMSHDVDIPVDADGPYWWVSTLERADGASDADPSNNTRSVPIYIDGPQQPELAIQRFDSPRQGLPGGSIVIHYEVGNIGQGWANTKTDETPLNAANWVDRIYLSEDKRLDETDLPLRSFERTAPLGPGDDYRHERIALNLPRGIAGKYYLILVADNGQQLDQPSFTKGFRAHEIELIDRSAPDLVVAGIEKIDRLVIDRPTPVTFSIANLGNKATSSDWMDGVYLSPEPVLDSRSIPLDQINSGQPLNPRGRYETKLPVTVPGTVKPGQWFLVVKADASGSIAEPGFEDNNTLALPVTVMTQQQADAEIQLGKPEAPERMVVQWIEHDRLEEHMARLSRTVQPALQDKADPVPDAPLIFDPQPPSIARQPGNPAGEPNPANRTPQPTENEDARPKPNATAPSETDRSPRPQDPGTQANTRVDGLTGNDGDAPQERPGIDRPLPPTLPTPSDPTPGDNGNPSPLPGEEKVDSPEDPNAPNTDSTTESETPSEIETDTDADNPEKTPATQPSEQLTPVEVDDPSKNDQATEPSEDDGEGDADKKTDQSTSPKPSEDTDPKPEGQPDQPSEAGEDQTPTSAPKDPKEAPPTNNRKIEVKLQPGKVLVGKGIEVTTKLPTRPGTGASRLSLPRNARISVTFNSKGEVFEAKILRSTTYKEWDAAIEASLYRWSARGEAVDEAEPHITIEWDYILNELLGDDD